MNKPKDEAYMGYYIDGQPLCIHMSKKKVLKYLSITRRLNEDDYFILKVSFDKVYPYDRLYLTTEYDKVYTNIDIVIINDMYHNTIDELANVYNILKDNRKILTTLLDSSSVDKTIDRIKQFVEPKEKWNDLLADTRYEFFMNHPINKMDIYSYLQLRESAN